MEEVVSIAGLSDISKGLDDSELPVSFLIESSEGIELKLLISEFTVPTGVEMIFEMVSGWIGSGVVTGGVDFELAGLN
jgi:hypothetical protein